jgi:cytochrome P450
MVEYDPFLPQVIEDPHPVYAKLREEDPCCFLPKYDTWFLSRFEDIWNASMDADSYSTESGSTWSQLVTKIQPVTPMINNMDPPRHTHMRAKIVPYFTPGTVRRLEPQIVKFVADAFAGVRDQKQADLFNDFAAKVSVKVACLANGFPMEDSDMLNGLVWRFFAREEGVEGMTQDGVNAMMEMFAYFGELIAKRRATGADGETVVDLVCRYEDESGRELDVQSASSHLSMFLIGGAETFPKTFASAVLRFWQHKDQRAELAKDPTLIPEAYREVLRYDMPTQFLMRKLVKPVKLHDKTMQPGQNVAFLYPSANRDRREFPDPDRFDIKRNPPRILSFGHGTHLCIGQHFARMEAKHCIQTLLDWAPDYEVKADQLRRLKTEFVQGWESMPVVFNR